MNVQISISLPYTNNEATAKKKINGSIPFTAASKPLRYLGINLTKEAKDLYSENYKTLMKEFRHKAMEKHSMLMDQKNKYC